MTLSYIPWSHVKKLSILSVVNLSFLSLPFFTQHCVLCRCVSLPWETLLYIACCIRFSLVWNWRVAHHFQVPFLYQDLIKQFMDNVQYSLLYFFCPQRWLIVGLWHEVYVDVSGNWRADDYSTFWWEIMQYPSIGLWCNFEEESVEFSLPARDDTHNYLQWKHGYIYNIAAQKNWYWWGLM